MTTYYVDTAGSNTAPYDTWAKAATNMQTAVDTAVAGDTVYCRGTQVLTVPIDFDINGGSVAAGFIKYIGCNAAGAVDGTRFVLNANSTASMCIDPAAKHLLWFENLELTGATGAGCDYGAAASNNHYWVNCYAHDNTGPGWDLYYDSAGGIHFILCKSASNLYGWYSGYQTETFYFCSAIGNTNGGLQLIATSGAFVHGCIIHGNGGHGILVEPASGGGLSISNCIIDGNAGNGIYVNKLGAAVRIIGNRITNNGAYGIDNIGTVLHGWNFFNANTSGNTNGGIIQAIPSVVGGVYDADTNEISGTEGYINRTSDDFNLSTSATLRSVVVELP